VNKHVRRDIAVIAAAGMLVAGGAWLLAGADPQAGDKAFAWFATMRSSA